MNSRPRRRRVAALTGTAAIATTAFVVLAEPAAAESIAFDCVEQSEEWRVPAGVTSATFDVYGAQGGNGFAAGRPAPLGGKGGRATATLAVTPGASTTVTVGCKGGRGSTGFVDGGFGDGRGGATFDGGGSGGGASRVLGIVAGGGGGGGQAFDATVGGGGAGGGVSGSKGDPGSCRDTNPRPFANPGTGGTGTEAGKGGQWFNCFEGGPGFDGSGGTGGRGGNHGGGGGGGGLFGGGGGAAGIYSAGGGGGSGAGLAGTTLQTGVRSGDGLVMITWTAPTGQEPTEPPGSTGPITVPPTTTTPSTAPKPAPPAQATAATPRFTG